MEVIKFFIKFKLILIVLVISNNSNTEIGKNYLYVDIIGSIELGTCTTNNGEPIDVDFEDVMTTRINGEFYKKRINAKIDCNYGYPNSLEIKISGAPSEFAPNLLTTSQENLAIQFKFNNENVIINKTKRLRHVSDDFYFDIILVRKDNGELSSGNFNASATLEITYQ